MLSFTKQDLDQFFNQSYSPENLVSLFEKDFRNEFNASGIYIGLWEGYSLKQHTLMVLNQFEKYFAHKKLPVDFDTNLFRVILTLHDIGKPEAIRNEGKHNQHKYTLRIVEPVLNGLGFDKRDINIALSLIGGDPVGKYVKFGGLEENAIKLKEMADKTELLNEDFLSLLLVYYKVDAGSYTLDAGGFKSLDRLFIFDRKNQELRFAPDTAAKVEQLKTRLKSFL